MPSVSSPRLLLHPERMPMVATLVSDAGCTAHSDEGGGDARDRYRSGTAPANDCKDPDLPGRLLGSRVIENTALGNHGGRAEASMRLVIRKESSAIEAQAMFGPSHVGQPARSERHLTTPLKVTLHSDQSRLRSKNLLHIKWSTSVSGDSFQVTSDFRAKYGPKTDMQIALQQQAMYAGGGASWRE